MSMERRYALIGHVHGNDGGGPDSTSTVVSTDGSLNVASTVVELNTEYDVTVNFATDAETDAGTIDNKAVQPEGGAYAYDRKRHWGQHEAGKGTETVTLTPDTGVITVDGQLSNVFRVVLDGDDYEFANPVNPINGQTINIHLIQDVTGGRQVTFDSQWKFANRIDPVLTEDGNAEDMLSCQWDETAAVMKCTFIPNFGAGYTPPATPDFEDFAFINVGGGNELFRNVTGTDVNFRTIVGDGDIAVSTVDDTVVVSYTSPVIDSVQYLGELLDVNTDGAQAGDTLTFDGENWVPGRGRKWTLGATWTNGANVLALPVNAVSAVISEKCVVLGWYILTAGGLSACQVDVRRVPIAEFPPLSSDSICGGDKPAISSAFMGESFDMTDWDAECEEGDLIQFVLESTSVFTTVQIVLILEKRV
jgi:hypothetical protein